MAILQYEHWGPNGPQKTGNVSNFGNGSGVNDHGPWAPCYSKMFANFMPLDTSTEHYMYKIPDNFLGV